MAKRSQRHPVRHEKDQTGCMWGLISIFDFRHGRTTPKLISDRRRSSKCAGGAAYSRTKLSMLANSEDKFQSVEDGKESETEKADAIKTNVKYLMEEQMINDESSKTQMDNVEAELKQSNSKRHIRKNSNQINKTNRKSVLHICDLGANSDLGTENCHQVAGQKTSESPDLRVIMDKLYHQIHQRDTSCLKHDWHDDIEIQTNKKVSVSEEKLSTAIQLCVDQWLANGKHLTEDEKGPCSKELMDDLQILTANKELLSELLQDPNSPFMRHIQELENAQLEKGPNSNTLAGNNLFKEDLNTPRPSELIIHKRRNFFRRRSKSQESFPLTANETCQSSSRIVILKPGQAGLPSSDINISVGKLLQSDCTIENKTQNERNASQFSFAEIKRKLKNAMGKEQHGNSHQKLDNSENCVDAESVRLCSPNRDHFYIEKFAKPPISIKRREKIGTVKDFETGLANETTGYPQQGTSNFYIEAKKHLSVMVTNGDRCAEVISRQSPETLGRILSLPEYSFSPSCSPGNDREHMRMSPGSNLHMFNENSGNLIQDDHAIHPNPSRKCSESQSCIVGDYPDEKVDSPNSNLDGSYELNHHGPMKEDLVSAGDETGSKGVLDTVRSSNTGNEDGEVLDVLHEPSGSLVTSDVHSCDSIVTSDDPDGETSSPCLKLDASEPDQLLSSPVASPSCSLLTETVEGSESTIDRTEGPSPISVLEPLFSEDDVSPASTIRQSAESTIQPMKIHFEEPESSASDQRICVRTCMEDEESAFEYVEALLLGSGLVWDEFLIRWISSYEVLDPSLFDEVELFSNRSLHDQKLLFDCTNEVLTEVCERYFHCFPRILNLRHNVRPIPKAMDLIHEVWKGVEWHLLQDAPSRSLDQLIRKDMAKSMDWINLRSDFEHIGIKIEEAILEELMDDAILSFTSDSLEESFCVLPEESNKNECGIDS